ncbi:ABC transporter ATP-binding protein [Paenibacillus yanchengensis]|uniref:ABC transporter ATP-binding protein n=1 Tax=Paenibacillus yanchengensis TaxID=2035833 RepID=A0ABW4YP25_9BACL
MIHVEGVSHYFQVGKRGKERKVPVLHDINFSVAKQEILAIVGRSGSGKSTLLNLMSGYTKPTSGSIEVMNKKISEMNEGNAAQFRLEHYGFIFQSFQLIAGMTAFENVELPLTLKKMNTQARRKQVQEMLERFGIAEFGSHYPGELSGGQQQRVAVARALILQPPIILADEPTGSLDNENEKQLLTIIQQLNHEWGTTFVIITHDEEVASIAHRTITLNDGRIIANVPAHREIGGLQS